MSKKIKKEIKKMPKRFMAFIVIFAMIFSYFASITNVIADGEYVVTFTTNDDHEMINDNGILRIDGQYVELRNASDERIGVTECDDENTCTITVSDGTPGTLNYNSDHKFTLYMQGHIFDVSHTFRANEDIMVQNYEEEHYVEPGPEPGERFDGRAVLVWSCGSGVCYHEFGVDEHGDLEIGDFDDGNSTFFNEKDIEADNKPGTTFDVHAEYAGWYLTDEFTTWQGLYEVATGNPINWNTVNPELILGEPNQHIRELAEAAVDMCGEEPTEHSSREERNEYERCVNLYGAQQGQIWTHKLQPVGEPSDNNAYVSYGDRNFKVVIYNDNYKGISTTSDFAGLHYYPSNWADPFLRTDQYDVSGTDKNHPTLLESILLENTVNIDVLPYNNYNIESIEALDVPDGAVTITKVNSHKFQLVFSSNFYDHVVFQITDTNNIKSYVQIKRYTIDGYIRYDNERHIPVLAADFYFDRTRSYQDFIITAKIVYKDGTVENATLEPINGFFDGLGNPVDGWELDQENPEFEFSGKGLKMSRFEYDLEQDADRNIKDVYLNAEYRGGDANTYAGAYAGSGEGTPANIYHPEGGE